MQNRGMTLNARSLKIDHSGIFDMLFPFLALVKLQPIIYNIFYLGKFWSCDPSCLGPITGCTCKSQSGLLSNQIQSKN